MKEVIIENRQVLHRLGNSTAKIYEQMLSGKSGISHGQSLMEISVTPSFTRFESAILEVMNKARDESKLDFSSPQTLLLLASTKGNISLLNPNKRAGFSEDRIHLWKSAEVLSAYYKNPNKTYVVSMACISGAQALHIGAEILKKERYDHVVVAAADELSPFISSGFESLKALSNTSCKPFDAERNGLHLGEGAACAVLSYRSPQKGDFVLQSGAVAADANHISGPSRTGEGLVRAIREAFPLEEKESLAFINLHGTGTPYNDEMEALALSRLSLSDLPVNSMKAYLGHTMGAAGLIETLLCCEALQRETAVQSLGYETHGVSVPLNVCKKNIKTEADTFLKTVSGFGGINLALWIRYIR